MQNINHEYYVSLEVGKLLKEAGFDWETKNWWDYCKPIDEWSLRNYPEAPVNWNSKYYNYDCSAPTLDVAQRWLREEKDLILLIDITPSYCNGKLMGYKFVIHVSCGNHIFGEWKDTYEEAQEAGIKKALEMISKKA